MTVKKAVVTIKFELDHSSIEDQFQKAQEIAKTIKESDSEVRIKSIGVSK